MCIRDRKKLERKRSAEEKSDEKRPSAVVSENQKQEEIDEKWSSTTVEEKPDEKQLVNSESRKCEATGKSTAKNVRQLASVKKI